MKFDSCKHIALAVALGLGSGAALAQKPEAPKDYGQTANSREAVRAEAREAARNSANTMTPSGEASTMSNGQPNMVTAPDDPARGRTSAQLSTQRQRQGEPPAERYLPPTNPDGTVYTPVR